MFKTSLLYTLLIIFILSLHPVMAVGAPQHTDINKPTRERVNKNNKQDDNKKASKDAAAKKDDNKKASSKATATDNKNKNTPAKATDDKNAPAKAVDNKTAATKPAEKKDDKVKDAAAPATDTAKKAAPAAPKRIPQDPNVVQFDGIDVSKHQGNINWAELKKNTKIKFVYIKATEGADYIDPRYRENILNAKKHGFKVGSYHFLSTKSSAVKQFQNFINTAKREEQDLLPVIDVEKLKPWSSQQLRDSLKVFADLLEDYYGCKPLIYTSEKFFTSNLGRAFADYPLFIAKYSTAAPNINYPWIIWQFSDCGIFKSAVRENRGEVDMSRFAKGHSINDILYVPSKHKPKNASVKESVDHKEKPTTVTMTEQKAKEAPKQTKRQQEEAQKKAEKDKKKQERDKKLAEQERQKKLEQEKKEREKAEAQKKAEARRKAHEAELQRQAEEKAKRKEAARQTRMQQEQEKKNAAKTGTKKATSLMSTSSSKLTQSQRNDSIRAAKQQGRKTNKSSADND